MCAKFDQFLPTHFHFESKRSEKFVRIAKFPYAAFGPLFALHCPLFFTRSNDLECKSSRFAAVVRRSVADRQLHLNGIIRSAGVSGKSSARKRSTQRNAAIAVQTPCREQGFFSSFLLFAIKQGLLLINPRNIICNIIMIFNINSTRGQTRFLTCVARVTCLVRNKRSTKLGAVFY